ncbi:hypothetical protein RUND412_008540 [Rhizina undulata]
MKFSNSAIIAAAAFLPVIRAHLIMTEPKQWTIPVITRATTETSDGPSNPLQADGSNFPCHGVAPEDSVATYEPGSTQTLQLQGSAVHSGGSGQMSITYDTTPTKDTVFRVMTSWEGSHPLKIDGNISPADASHMLDPLQFKVPANLPAGKAVVAWTWFNKSGNREMYMKCATVTIGGSETSKAAFEALPSILRGNSGNGCTIPENIDAIKFNNPGPDVVGTGVTAVACDSSEAGTGSSSSSSSDSSSGSSSSAAAAAPSATAATAATSEAPAEAASTTSASTAATSSGGACTDGAVTCDSDTTWSMCANGVSTSMGAVPAGTTCKNGTFVKRDLSTIRFSPEHSSYSHKHKRRNSGSNGSGTSPNGSRPSAHGSDSKQHEHDGEHHKRDGEHHGHDGEQGQHHEQKGANEHHDHTNEHHEPKNSNTKPHSGH